MIQLKKTFSNIDASEMKKLVDIPVWLSLYAAYSADGIISESERAEAIKLAHLRTFTAPKSLQKYYESVDNHFEDRFNSLNGRLPSNDHDRKIYLDAQIKSSYKIIEKLDPDTMESLEESLKSFYEHVFKADTSFFQFFALPVISNRLEKKSGNFEFESN